MTVADDLATLREGLRVFGREVGMHAALDRVDAEIARRERHPDAWSQQAFDQQKQRAEAAEAEAARLRDGLRALVTLVRIGFLVSVNGERATAETVNDPTMRQVLFTILQAKDSDEAARALLAKEKQ